MTSRWLTFQLFNILSESETLLSRTLSNKFILKYLKNSLYFRTTQQKYDSRSICYQGCYASALPNQLEPHLNLTMCYNLYIYICGECTLLAQWVATLSLSDYRTSQQRTKFLVKTFCKKCESLFQKVYSGAPPRRDFAVQFYKFSVSQKGWKLDEKKYQFHRRKLNPGHQRDRRIY
jgi:hypothetical protein